MNSIKIVGLATLLGLFFSCKSKQVVVAAKKPVRKSSQTSGVLKRTTTKKKPVKQPKKSTVKRVIKEKSAPPYNSYTAKVSNYIDLYGDIAMEQMRQYNIPASITLAQGILESGAGTGKLTMRSNNHFGIKCHDWKGLKVYHDDDKKGECFRKYSIPKFSFQDHSIFLSTRGRYFNLFKLPKDDYKGWAKGLQAAGYATDPKYPSKLIRIIEKNKLYRFDALVLGKTIKRAKKVTAIGGKYTVSKGDTLYSIAKKNKLKVDELKALNGLDNNTIFEGQVLFVKPLPKDF